MRKKTKGKIKYHPKNTLYKGISWISILIAVALGSLVIGGFLFIPSTKRTPITTEYVTIPDPSCEGNNLHLCTFIVVTVTPTPRPTRTPNDDNGGGGGGGGHNGDDPPPPGGGGGGPKPL